MGVYSRVEFLAFCPRCGKQLTDEFQAKDEQSYMDDRLPEDCSEWYSKCEGCGMTVEFSHLREGEINLTFRPKAIIRISLDEWRGGK